MTGQSRPSSIWAPDTSPLPGAWCTSCHGQRWWYSPNGFWNCAACHPPRAIPGTAAAGIISTALPEPPRPAPAPIPEPPQPHAPAPAPEAPSLARAPTRVVGAKPRSLAALRTELRKAAVTEAGAKPYRPHPSTRGLPPLWTLPPPIQPSFSEGHNGGPPLEPRRLGRPTTLTPEVRSAILGALMTGCPIRAMATVPGFPHPVTIRRWRAADPEFAAAFDQAQWLGWTELGLLVIEEVDENLERHGVKHTRWVASRRMHSLAQQAPRAFGGDGDR